LDELLEDEARLEQLQQAAIEYWDNTLAPPAVAQYIVECLSSLDAKVASNDEDAATHYPNRLPHG